MERQGVARVSVGAAQLTEHEPQPVSDNVRAKEPRRDERAVNQRQATSNADD